MSIFQSEEKKRTKTYDIKILKWLFRYIKPNSSIFILSLILMILTAFLEIAIPYLTKHAVDNHIYPTWILLDKNADGVIPLARKYPNEFIELRNESYLINVLKIDNVDKIDLEKGNSNPEAKYMVFNESYISPEKRTELLNVFKKNKDIFYNFGEIHYAKFEDIKSLSGNEVRLLRSKNHQSLKKYVLLIFASLLGVFIFTSAFTYLLFYSGHGIMHSIRRDAFSHILKLPQTFFDKTPVGRVTTRITNDVNAINEMYTSVLVQLVKDILVIIGIIAIMFTMDVKLTVIILCLTIFLTIVAAMFRMRLKTVFRNIRVTIGKLNSFVQESIQGITLIKLYGRDYENFKRFSLINKENYSANMSQLWAYIMFRPFIEYMSVLGIAVILWFGGRDVISHSLTLGGLIAFLYYVRMLFHPIQHLSERYHVFQSAAAASENLYDLINEPIEKNGSKEPAVSSPIIPIIEFKNVWFSYNDRDWVLKNISFKIRPGETMALVGLTGSGKTTIVNLILKLYKIQKGEILFNGINVNDVNNDFLMSRITAIFQDLFLFGKDISDDPVDYKKTSSYFGLNKNISEENILSSGENQLVAFTKAINKVSDILIMDEATSSVDAETEKRIQKIIKDHGKKTALIIAHKLSNIHEADRIIVIHKGEIVESGNHQELLKNNGIYNTLHNYQKQVLKVKTGLKA